MISWWYTSGWKKCVLVVGDSLLGVYDYFSIDLLIKTLFSPFRQISAGKVTGSFEAQLRGIIDKLISRVIGAFMRTIVIVIGTVALLLASLIGLLRIVIWPVVPLIPVLAVLFAMAGWIPWMI